MSFYLITTKVKSIQLLIALQDKDNRETLAERQGDRSSALNESWLEIKGYDMR